MAHPPKRSGKAKVKLKTARGRKTSSQRWLQRQLNDPYVLQAKKDGYRSRAVYKLQEIDDKLRLIRAGCNVVDLGAAPGSWTQLAVERAGQKGHVIGLDLQPMESIAGATLMQGDFMDDGIYEQLLERVGDARVHLVMSDMAAAACGHTQTDHLRIMALCEAAYDFAAKVLAPGGAFLAKVLRGGTESELLQLLRKDFTAVKHIKPQASRQDSAEMYVVATGFKGGGE